MEEIKRVEGELEEYEKEQTLDPEEEILVPTVQKKKGLSKGTLLGGLIASAIVGGLFVIAHKAKSKKAQEVIEEEDPDEEWVDEDIEKEEDVLCAAAESESVSDSEDLKKS